MIIMKLDDPEIHWFTHVMAFYIDASVFVRVKDSHEHFIIICYI